MESIESLPTASSLLPGVTSRRRSSIFAPNSALRSTTSLLSVQNKSRASHNRSTLIEKSEADSSEKKESISEKTK